MTDVHALAGAYVLDAVDDVERAAFARHLAECESCATETDELRAAVVHLADSAWSVPPPRLRAEVLARVAQTRQERPRSAQRGGVSRWRRVTLVAAAVVALGAAGGVAAVAVHDQQTTQARADAESARVRAILGSPDAVVRRVGVDGGGQLTVVTSADRDAGVVLVTDAPAIPTSKAYELWLLQGGEAVPAATLAAGSTSGTTVVTGLRSSSGVAMTREKAGGAQMPTRPLLAQVALAS